jgi:hypothetical protein
MFLKLICDFICIKLISIICSKKKLLLRKSQINMLLQVICDFIYVKFIPVICNKKKTFVKEIINKYVFTTNLRFSLHKMHFSNVHKKVL